MHTLLRVTMTDVGAANQAVGDGRLQKTFERISKMINPENAFFYSDQGYRAALFVFDMKDASMIPQLAEPFFTEFNAKVEFLPVMNTVELTHGLDSWKKHTDSLTPLS